MGWGGGEVLEGSSRSSLQAFETAELVSTYRFISIFHVPIIQMFYNLELQLLVIEGSMRVVKYLPAS